MATAIVLTASDRALVSASAGKAAASEQQKQALKRAPVSFVLALI
jgi:hypothetical protein